MKESDRIQLVIEKKRLERRILEINNTLHIGLEQIEKDIKSKYGWDIREKARYSELVHARNEFFYIAREAKFKLEEIGDFLGFNHATVIHGVKSYKLKINKKIK